MEDALPEWRYIDPAHPLSQGDVVRRVQDADIWDRFAIVVTADCDLAHNKHRGQLTCVPVVPLRDYLATYYLPMKLRELEGRLSEQLVALIRAAQRDNYKKHTNPISIGRAEQWVLETSPKDIAEQLMMDSSQRDRLGPLATNFKKLRGHASVSFDASCRLYIETQCLLNGGGNETQLRRRLTEMLANHTRDLPSDALFLTSIGEGLDGGFVAYLRTLHSLRDSLVTLRVSRLEPQAEYERIATLQPRYLFALTQRLASVFSSIGLPEEYERARTECAGALLAEDGSR